MERVELIQPNKDFSILTGEQVDLKVDAPNDLQVAISVTDSSNKVYYIDLEPQSGVFVGAFSPKHAGKFELQVATRENKYVSYKDSSSSISLTVLPEWTATAVAYNLFLRSSSNSGVNGSLEDVLVHIDKIADAGITTLYINPFYDTGVYLKKHVLTGHPPNAEMQGTPYAIRDMSGLDAYSVASDPAQITRGQTQRVVRDFVNAAHNRGIRVLFDLVLNHTSHDFPLQRYYPEWFLYKQDILSTDSLYLHFQDGKPWGDPNHTVVPFENGDFYWSDTAKLNWEYYAPPAPNDPPSNPSLALMFEYFITVAKYWVREFGIDGYRCDLAHRIPPDFWRACTKAVKQEAAMAYPHNESIDGECIFVAEAPDSERGRLLSAGFDFVYEDLSDEVNTRRLSDIVKVAESDPYALQSYRFVNAYDFHAKHSSPYEVASIDPADHVWSWAFVATLPGLAMYHSGFEDLSWHGVPGADVGIPSDMQVVKQVKQINKVRSEHPALQGAGVQLLEVSGANSENVIAYARYSAHGTMFVIINSGDILVSDTYVSLQAPQFDPEQKFILKDELTGKIFLRESPELGILMQPGDIHLFSLEQSWGDHSY